MVSKRLLASAFKPYTAVFKPSLFQGQKSMTSKSVVRLATPEDEAGIFHLCKLLHGENGLFPMDDELVEETIKNGITQNGGIIGLIGPPDALEGIIYLSISHFWYSRKPHLEELFNFVHPDFRRSDHAKALIDFAKSCTSGNIRLVIGVVSNERTEAKVRLYERRLGKPAGAFFVYPTAN